MESITVTPSEEAFTPLSEHQGQTPGTFFGGKPVLHHYCPSAKLLINADRLQLSPILANLQKNIESETHTNGSTDTESKDVVVIDNLDIWVTSQYLIIYSTSKMVGARIFYPTIVLHATRRMNSPQSTEHEVSGLFTQLILGESSQDSADEVPISIEMTLVPPLNMTNTENSGNGSDLPDRSEEPVKVLYEAVSTCTALHPDPVDEDDGEDQDNIPGAGGWVTADNAENYFDEDGQFVGFGENGANGPIAGSIRTREDQFHDQNGASEDNNGTTQAGDEQQETKWRRLD